MGQVNFGRNLHDINFKSPNASKMVGVLLFLNYRKYWATTML